MSLADDCSPGACPEICTANIQKNFLAITKHIPTGNECSQAELAKKYTILGRCFREIRIYTKEALKSIEMGSSQTVVILLEQAAHKTLDEFSDAKVKISIDGGSEVETTFGKFERAAEAVQRDPGILDEVSG